MTRLLITASNSFKCTIKLETQGNRKVSLADRHRVVVGPLHGRSTRLPMFASRLACMGTTPNVSTSETQTLEQDTVFRRGFPSRSCVQFARCSPATIGQISEWLTAFVNHFLVTRVETRAFCTCWEQIAQRHKWTTFVQNALGSRFIKSSRIGLCLGSRRFSRTEIQFALHFDSSTVPQGECYA